MRLHTKVQRRSLMKKQSEEYVELDYTYNFGMPLPQKLHPDMLPDTYLSHNPIELQEVYYAPDKKGYRNAYSYRPTMEQPSGLHAACRKTAS